MSQDCSHPCKDNWVFPREIKNRPGLQSIDYRIGTYADFRRALMQKLDRDPVLTNWTYREADDPGIALLEGAAILGDILTFYENLYANEAYLRTAQWRQSIAELVRLLGYRLSPGVGGRTTFAFEVKGENKVVIPKGFPVQVQLDKTAQPADFQVAEAVTAYPELSKFQLFRPLNTDVLINSATKDFFVARSSASTEQVPIAEGDRLLVGEFSALSPHTLSQAEIMVVESVREMHGQKVFRIKGALQNIHNNNHLTGFKIGRTFNHFGHNAPPFKVVLPEADAAADGGTGTADNTVTSEPVTYDRSLDIKTEKWVEPPLETNQVPLDREVDDIAPGTLLIWQWPSDTDDAAFFTINKVGKGSYSLGALSGGVTLLELIPDNVTEGTSLPASLDIRNVLLHEAGPLLNIFALPQTVSNATGQDLFFFGSEQAALALTKRVITIKYANGDAIQYTADSVAALAADAGEYSPLTQFTNAWRIFLDKAVAYADFPHERMQTNAYGNLAVGATQGKSEKESVLGNGDSREIFQTFKLPKKPLTFLKDTASTPPEVPELEIYVNKRKWTCVDSLFGKGPKDEVYIVRLDEEGESWVQFGDGKTGVCLPSGVKNVVARFRTGIGAYGKIKEGTTANGGARLDRLNKIHMPGEAFDGAEEESGENARQAAPGKVQSLGRLVSLKDYEFEALAIAGVVKAEAAWGVIPNTYNPALLLTVLMEHDRDVESYGQLEKTMNEYNRERGPERFPVIVVSGSYKYITMGVMVGYDTSCRTEDLEILIRKALGVFGEEANGIDCSQGLLSLSRRKFGQPEYRTRVQGIVQQIPGVMWVDVTSLDTVTVPDAPENIILAGQVGVLCEKITCSKTQILSIYTKHLFVTFHGEELKEQA